MCGRFAVIMSPEMMQELYRILNTIEFPPRYNIAPTQPIVAIWEGDGARQARLARWGLVPGWVKDPREFSLLVNARAETMAEKPSFKTSLKHQRCIVPASGYYEWHTGPDKTKTPYYISMANGQPMALAGLYSTWMGPNGEEVDTTALITVGANSDLSYIHDRMPAIIPPERIDDWLDTKNVDAREALQMALPLPPGQVTSHRVSRRVNSNTYDDPDLIAPLVGEEPSTPPKPKATSKAPPDGQMDLF